MLQFSDLGLSECVLQAVKRLEYEIPTPVQAQAIPLILEGVDIIAAAQTGTGKTAAFALPLLDRLGHAQTGQGPRMLVITPTRELAQQIGKTCNLIAVSTHHRVLSVVGGLSYEPQIKQLHRGTDVLIATPGRLADLMEQGEVRLDSVEALVLDEADRMLDMGFLPAVRKIVGTTPPSRQTLLFSATVDRSVQKSVGTLLHNPKLIEIAHKGETADTVEQYLIHTSQAAKPALLKAVLTEYGARHTLVFTRTRSRADSVCRRLKQAGFSAGAIHSDRSQNQRRQALDSFAAGTIDILVATDILARGIDVEKISYVVNYDLPVQSEDYIHRIGRTGRAGTTGFAVSFVSPDTEDALHDIERLIKRPLPEMQLETFDIQKAEEDALAKKQRAQMRRDPEIIQAVKEEAARKRKKAAHKRAQSAQNNRGNQHRTTKKPAGRKAKDTAQKFRHSATNHIQPDMRPGRAHRATVAARRAARRDGIQRISR